MTRRLAAPCHRQKKGEKWISWIFRGFSGPVDLYTVFLRPSRTVHCIFGSKNPGQKPGQKSGQKSGQKFGQKSRGGCLLTGGAG